MQNNKIYFTNTEYEILKKYGIWTDNIKDIMLRGKIRYITIMCDWKNKAVKWWLPNKVSVYYSLPPPPTLANQKMCPKPVTPIFLSNVYLRTNYN